jgi:non-canonical (house-cleaning) NTP pyrophosphatase
MGLRMLNETFELKIVSVPSGVSIQPMSSQETLRGAFNRAHGAFELIPTGDFWVGIEGGVEDARVRWQLRLGSGAQQR